MSRYTVEYPLHEAAASGDIKRIRELLSTGVKIDWRTQHFETPLMAAVRSARLEVVQIFIDTKADINAKDRASAISEGKQTALHRAVRFGYLKIAKALLEVGAEVDCLSQHKNTPLMHACWISNLEMVRLLLDCGANPNNPDGCGEYAPTPLHACCTNSAVALMDKRQTLLETAHKIARELLKRGASPNKQGRGESPLHHAMPVALARELLAAGADVNARDAGGQTPLILLALAGSSELLRCFVEAGADVNAKSDSGQTALMGIINRSPPEIEVIEMLVKAGADINAVDKSGRFVLDKYAAVVGRLEHEAKTDNPILRTLFKVKDYLKERTAYIQFLKDRGAKSELERCAAEKPTKKQKR